MATLSGSLTRRLGGFRNNYADAGPEAEAHSHMLSHGSGAASTSLSGLVSKRCFFDVQVCLLRHWTT
jgi:hypothetical protein